MSPNRIWVSLAVIVSCAAVPGVRDRIMHIGQLNMFLQAIRRRQWEVPKSPLI